MTDLENEVDSFDEALALGAEKLDMDESDLRERVAEFSFEEPEDQSERTPVIE